MIFLWILLLTSGAIEYNYFVECNEKKDEIEKNIAKEKKILNT